jgi:hypothetical protein
MSNEIKQTAVIKKRLKIDFQKFENVIEILPSFYYYKQTFREWHGKGVFVIAWFNFGIVIHIEKTKHTEVTNEPT